VPGRTRPRLRAAADQLLNLGLRRLASAGRVLIPEYPARPRARWGWDSAPEIEAVATRLAAGGAGYEPSIEAVCSLLEWARGIPRHATRPGEPCWENDWWGTLDVLFQCAALRSRDPAMYLEVGSGYSTLFARRAIEDFGLRTRIVSIDPAPRADVDAACDEVIRSPLEDVPAGVFERLAAGDVILIDGSHVALMNSDTTVFFLELLPRLGAGVLVGIDDVFLPWDYPPTWAGRMYGEQYLLAALLLGGADGLQVRFPGWWLVECSAYAPRFDALWPVVENRFGRHATSFWMETA
jgi:hypothetical protein